MRPRLRSRVGSRRNKTVRVRDILLALSLKRKKGCQSGRFAPKPLRDAAFRSSPKGSMSLGPSRKGSCIVDETSTLFIDIEQEMATHMHYFLAKYYEREN